MKREGTVRGFPGYEMFDLLERVGWTNRYFAKRISVNEDTVSHWVRGDSAGPGYNAGVEYLRVIARILGV